MDTHTQTDTHVFVVFDDMAFMAWRLVPTINVTGTCHPKSLKVQRKSPLVNPFAVLYNGNNFCVLVLFVIYCFYFKREEKKGP